MKRILILFSILLVFGCSVEDAEKKREETLQKFNEQREEIDDEIDRLKKSTLKATEDAKADIEEALQELKKQKKDITKEAESLRKASKKELEEALEKAKKEFEDWKKE